MGGHKRRTWYQQALRPHILQTAPKPWEPSTTIKEQMVQRRHRLYLIRLDSVIVNMEWSTINLIFPGLGISRSRAMNADHHRRLACSASSQLYATYLVTYRHSKVTWYREILYIDFIMIMHSLFDASLAPFLCSFIFWFFCENWHNNTLTIDFVGLTHPRDGPASWYCADGDSLDVFLDGLREVLIGNSPGKLSADSLSARTEVMVMLTIRRGLWCIVWCTIHDPIFLFPRNLLVLATKG